MSTNTCGRCGAVNPIVNFCRCDQNNLPTLPQSANNLLGTGVVLRQATPEDVEWGRVQRRGLVENDGFEKSKINVCDDCRTAFYDEGFGLVSFTDSELGAVLDMGACIGDHNCEGDGCQCACPKNG